MAAERLVSRVGVKPMRMCVLVAVPMLVVSVVTAPAGPQPIVKPSERLGTVSFANSCASAVQPDFTRAVVLLHSFWWQQGEKAFRRVLDEGNS